MRNPTLQFGCMGLLHGMGDWVSTPRMGQGGWLWAGGMLQANPIRVRTGTRPVNNLRKHLGDEPCSCEVCWKVNGLGCKHSWRFLEDFVAKFCDWMGQLYDVQLDLLFTDRDLDGAHVFNGNFGPSDPKQ